MGCLVKIGFFVYFCVVFFLVFWCIFLWELYFFKSFLNWNFDRNLNFLVLFFDIFLKCFILLIFFFKKLLWNFFNDSFLRKVKNSEFLEICVLYMGFFVMFDIRFDWFLEFVFVCLGSCCLVWNFYEKKMVVNLISVYVVERLFERILFN